LRGEARSILETHSETSPHIDRPEFSGELRVLEMCGVACDTMGVAFASSGEVLMVTPALQAALRLSGEGSVTGRVLPLLAEEAPEGFEVRGELELADGTRLFLLTETQHARLERLLDAYAGRHHLTAAERAALAHVAEGLSAKVSAGMLHLSPETVRARRKRIFRKAGVDGCGAVLAQLLKA
jgi:DNA-binding CsgD family transcriptional regulator